MCVCVKHNSLMHIEVVRQKNYPFLTRKLPNYTLIFAHKVSSRQRIRKLFIF